MCARRTQVFWLLLAACTSDEPTRLFVSIDADEEVRGVTEEVRLFVRGQAVTSDETSTLFEETITRAEFSWPARTWVVPSGGDASRRVAIDFVALDGRGQPLARVRAETGFVANQTRSLYLNFDAECLRMLACGADETCEGGQCVNARRLPDALPFLDASVASDAGTSTPQDAGDACTLIASYADRDRDGFGDPATRTMTCVVASGRVQRADDCDDDCRDCHSEGTEECDGRRDEDCDGTTDEGCACTSGARRPCPTGSDVGACAIGTQTCAEGVWGACSGAIGPRAESCNAIDDDCDGRVDEGVALVFYRDADGDGFGVAASRVSRCTAASGYVARSGDCDDACRACFPGAAEACDGTVDQDCDGRVDEGCTCRVGSTRACPDGTDVGRCAVGVQTCGGTGWGACTGQVAASAETCNAEDDDCDDRTDESISRACGPSAEVGACRRGTETCSAGAWGACVGAIMPSFEFCNGVDDDCDGETDEDGSCATDAGTPDAGPSRTDAGSSAGAGFDAGRRRD
jgi:hypothetical protein